MHKFLSRCGHLIIMVAVLAIAGCGLDSNSPYGRGYTFGKEMGAHGRNMSSYNIEGAKSRASEVGHLTKGEEGCPYEIGTVEYGDYMKGLESGYRAAYHR